MQSAIRMTADLTVCSDEKDVEALCAITQRSIVGPEVNVDADVNRKRVATRFLNFRQLSDEDLGNSLMKSKYSSLK